MAWVHVADVQGSGKKPYKIALQTEGEQHGVLGCSCPAWTVGWKRGGKVAERKDCKHIVAVRESLRATLHNAATRRRSWGDDMRRIVFKACAGDLFRCLIEHGCAGLELDDFTKMAVIAEAAPGLVLPPLNWATSTPSV